MTSYSAYKKQLSISSNIDLQTIYDADVDSGDAVITTNTTDGSVVIAGTESLKVTATGGILISAGAFQVTAAGDLTIHGVSYTFPATDGTSGQYLSTNGSGVLSWT